MIKVTFIKNDDIRSISLSIKGHAGQNEYGKDIVCASASILAYTLAQNISLSLICNMSNIEHSIRIAEGDTEISCKARNDHSYKYVLRIYEIILEGYVLLANDYPQYVELNQFGQA